MATKPGATGVNKPPAAATAAANGKQLPAAVDVSSLTEEERALYQKYGKLPSKKNIVGHKLKERKYFDSGDYAMYKAGRTSEAGVGTLHPSPEMIPHSNPTPNHQPLTPHHTHLTPVEQEPPGSTTEPSTQNASPQMPPRQTANNSTDPKQLQPEH